VAQAAQRLERGLPHVRVGVVERPFDDRHALGAAERAEQGDGAGAHGGVGRDRQRRRRWQQPRVGHRHGHVQRPEGAGAIRGRQIRDEWRDGGVAEPDERVLRREAAPAVAIAEHAQQRRHHGGLGPVQRPLDRLGADARRGVVEQRQDDVGRVPDQRADPGAQPAPRPEPAAAQRFGLGEQAGVPGQPAQGVALGAAQVRRQFAEQVDLQTHRQPHELAAERGTGVARRQRRPQRRAHRLDAAPDPAVVPPPPHGMRDQQGDAEAQQQGLREQHHADEGVSGHRRVPPAPSAGAASRPAG
jgi:hypothetical protein